MVGVLGGGRRPGDHATGVGDLSRFKCGNRKTRNLAVQPIPTHPAGALRARGTEIPKGWDGLRKNSEDFSGRHSELGFFPPEGRVTTEAKPKVVTQGFWFYRRQK